MLNDFPFKKKEKVKEKSTNLSIWASLCYQFKKIFTARCILKKAEVTKDFLGGKFEEAFKENNASMYNLFLIVRYILET